MTKTTMTITRPQNGIRKVCLDILIYFTGEISKSMISEPNKTIYSISGTIKGVSTMLRKIRVCYKEDRATPRMVITLEEVDGTFFDEIIIEESDTDFTTRKIIIEESETDFIIIEESETDISLIVKIPRGKPNNTNGKIPYSELKEIPK